MLRLRKGSAFRAALSSLSMTRLSFESPSGLWSFQNKFDSDLRNREGALLHCWWWRALLESEQGYSAPIPHA